MVIVSESMSSDEALVTNQTHVSTILATHLLSKMKPKSNVVFSPISMHVVLSKLAFCTRGQTLNQLLAFLKVNNVSDVNYLYSWLVPLIFADGSPYGGPKLSAANGVWIPKTCSLKPSFKEAVDTIYKANCKQVDFSKPDEVADEVNLWVKEHTNGIIKEILDPDSISPTTMLIFANAIYFKGAWCYGNGFDKSQTENLDFHLLDGNKVEVPFMRNSHNQYVREYDDFKVLGLPYNQGLDKRQFTMYIFLPDAYDGLHSLVEIISSKPDFLDHHIPCKKVEIRKFLIPKFKISTQFEAIDMLKELGLVLPFDACFKNITEMVEGVSLYCSRIQQKSFVEVNEEGTEAAAVTESDDDMGYSMFGDDERIFIDFVADHPFLFMIREDVSGVVLFMGHVINPSVDCTGS